MNDREKKLIKYKKQYLYLVNKITRLQLSGKNPPEKLLKQAQEIAQAAEIPETFLKSILV
jgi:hypothetical protein